MAASREIRKWICAAVPAWPHWPAKWRTNDTPWTCSPSGRTHCCQMSSSWRASWSLEKERGARKLIWMTPQAALSTALLICSASAGSDPSSARPRWSRAHGGPPTAVVQEAVRGRATAGAALGAPHGVTLFRLLLGEHKSSSAVSQPPPLGVGLAAEPWPGEALHWSRPTRSNDLLGVPDFTSSGTPNRVLIW